MELELLGKGNIKISQICIGTWAWGDKLVWGYGKGGYSDQDLKEAFKTSISLGVNFFDTAEMYGTGLSEELLGNFIRESNVNVVVATKFAPLPYRFIRNDLLKALKNSLKRLGLEKVSLYQIHFPYTLVSMDVWLNALADAYLEGFTDAVGISNFSLAQTKHAVSFLSKRGVQLTSNQVKFHLLSMNNELKALLDYCKENGITVLGYSALAQGILTGKYSANNPPIGVRGFIYSRSGLKRYELLINTLTDVGKKYGGTTSQAAINWVIKKGAVPIVGVKNAKQAEENIKATEWSLSEEDVALLDKISEIVVKTN